MSTRGGGGVRIPITADARGVGDGVRDAERALERLNKSAGRSFSGLRLAAGGAALALGTGLAAAARSGIQGMQEAERAAASLESVLKSTGNTTGMTKDQMIAMADAMERQTGIASETTQEAQALLATFSKIGKEAFPDATKAAIDMSVRFDQSAKSSAIQLGKALQDPIKGVSALTRIGVDFDEQQKKQIKTLVESNRVSEAQAIILGQVQNQAKGAANAYGQTLTGQLARAQHAWGAITEEIMVKLLPSMVAVLDWANRNFPRFRRAIQPVLDAIELIIKAIRDEDWEKMWRTIGDGLVRASPHIATAARALGRSLAQALVTGAVTGFRELAPDWLERVVGGGLSLGELGGTRSGAFGGGNVTFTPGPGYRVGDLPGLGAVMPGPSRRAMGGYIPGPRGAGDVVPALLTPGEVVLNEGQQRMLGVDRIVEILARTGGVMGGGRFNRGGVVATARQRAESNLGEPYGKPSEGMSRTGPNSWDCSGYATMIAGVDVGGTTASAYLKSTAVRDHTRYPIVWGFRKSHGGSYRGGYDEHMGVRVGGVWYQTANKRTARVGSDGSWSEIRVPHGLERIHDADAGGEYDASVSGGTARPRVTFGQLLAAATRGAPGGVVGRTTRTRSGPVTVGTEVSSIAGAYRGAVPDVSAGFGTGPDGADSRSIDRAGRDARDAARNERNPDGSRKNSAEEVRRRGEEAEANATKAWYRREIRQINRAMGNLKKRKARLLQSIRDLRASRAGNPGAKRRVVRALSGRVAQINAELAELREIRAELQNALGEILDDEAMETYEGGEGDGDQGDQGNTNPDGGVAEVDQAELVRARTNMLMTEWNVTGMGPGDLGTGGATAMSAAFPGGRTVTLTVGATSLVSAVASASGTQGYSTPAVVPAGV